MPAPEWVVENWPGSATVIAVRGKGIRDGKPTDETRYYVTSLRTGAEALLRHVRDRWSIENSWHWPRDTQLREDAHRYREVNGGSDHGHAPEPGHERAAARWVLVDHRGAGRPGPRHQGFTGIAGLARTCSATGFWVTSNEPWFWSGEANGKERVLRTKPVLAAARQRY